ncbi:trigger factor [Ectothiorhodospiraceae bacterium 2226]|nr:trigger factor [Ectothiorhodospiraceae bacterium 2226]
MQVSVESTGGLTRRMKVSVPAERIDQEVESRLKRMTRSVRIKGFRPGKVPFGVVQRQYGPQVRQEVVGEVVQSTFYEAVVQEKLRPAGSPSIEPEESGDADGGFGYVATFEVYPEVEPAPLEGVKIEKSVAQVADEDVERMIDNLRKQRRSFEAVERPAAEGDRVVMDYNGTIEGEDFPGNRGQDVPVELGSGRMIEGLEAGLIGAKAGETRTLDLKFPEDYHFKEVAGKPVQFEVTVKAVEESRLPEVDEAFAKGFGVEGGADALRAEVRGNMERELNQGLHAKAKRAVMDKLLELNAIDLPAALIDGEAGRLAQQMHQQLVAQGARPEDVKMDPSMFRDEASRRVALGLILAEIIKRQGFKADPAKVREMVDNTAASYEHPEEVVKWYYAEKGRLADLESANLEDQVVDWALEQADVVEQPTSFQEVMNPQATAQA